ncbi:type II secretion system (T2SS), M family protein, partial [Vibrio parahaemolyticus AQ3810]
DSAI